MRSCEHFRAYVLQYRSESLSAKLISVRRLHVLVIAFMACCFNISVSYGGIATSISNSANVSVGSR